MSTIVSVMFTNATGEILVHLRDDDPRILFPNQWSVIGGHVNDGEIPEAAMIRETQEEIGYSLTDFRRLATFYDGVHVRHLYTAPLHVPVSDLVLGEGQAIRFMNPYHALEELDLCVTGRRCIEAYIRHMELMDYLKQHRNESAAT